MADNCCPTCGATFDTVRGLRVHHAAKHDEHLPNRECAECGTEFYSEHEKKYCSEECRSAAVSFTGQDNPNYRDAKAETTCELCGTAFEYYSSEKPGKFCPSCVETEQWRSPIDIDGENNPRWKGGQLILSCAVCDAAVERYPSDVTGEVTLCSRDCLEEWLSEAFTGSGHPNWRGGGNESYGKRWRSARDAALERDQYTCVVCDASRSDLGRNPDVHHIVPVRAFVETPVTTRTDAHYLDNLVTLCPSCHRKAEFGVISASELRWYRDVLESPAPRHSGLSTRTSLSSDPER